MGGNMSVELVGTESVQLFPAGFNSGMLRAVLYSDQGNQWAAVEDHLDTNHDLDDLMLHAQGCKELLRKDPLDPRAAFTRVERAIPIRQKFKRRWNVVLFGRDVSLPGSWRYRIRGEGGTDVWGAGVNGPASESCPIRPVEFLREQINGYLTNQETPTAGPKHPKRVSHHWETCVVRRPTHWYVGHALPQ